MDGDQWKEVIKVEPSSSDGTLHWSAWQEGSTFGLQLGLGGQMDSMSPADAQALMAAQAEKRWVSKGSYAEQVEGLCTHYSAPAAFAAIKKVGWDSLDGKGVRFFKELVKKTRTSFDFRHV